METTNYNYDYSDKYIEIGYNIAYYRKHKNLTQEQLAVPISVPLKRPISCARFQWTCCSISPLLSTLKCINS